MKPKILTITLNPSLDKTVLLGANDKNNDLDTRRESISAGGKGINVSRALRCLGYPSVATGFLGGDSGQRIKVRLRQEKIKTEFIPVQGTTRINYTFIEEKTGLSTRIFGIEAKITQRDIALFLKKYKLLLRCADVVILSGRNVQGVADTFYADIIKIANQLQKKVVLDTSLKSLVKGIRARPFLIKPNIEEAQQVLNKRIQSKSALKQALISLHGMGPHHVVISLGSDGAVGFDGREFVCCHHPSFRVQNDVGCGDALIAGFIDGYYKTKDFSMAVKRGVLCGMSNALNLIPGKVNPRQFMNLNRKVILKKYI